MRMGQGTCSMRMGQSTMIEGLAVLEDLKKYGHRMDTDETFHSNHVKGSALDLLIRKSAAPKVD